MTRHVLYLLVLAILMPVHVFSQRNQEYIGIGLLLPDDSQSQIIKAAQYAIDEANSSGGYNNQEFRLLVRTAEGFWGAGSKESVNLVYEDQVRAFVGSLDGRNGHLAEQVATKSHLSYIEAFATEPTLSQAFVPWFMRVVPNDNQQAQIILQRIQMEGGGKICILSVDNYDTKYAVRSLTKTVARETGQSPLVIDLDDLKPDHSAFIEKIRRSNSSHLIIPFDAPYLGTLMGTLKQDLPDLKIYGTLHFTMGVERRKEDRKLYEGLFLISPLLNRQEISYLSDSRSAYVFDAINLVLSAVRQVGTDREAITEHISKSAYPGGATGSISFDELGNRNDAAMLLQVKNGIVQKLNHP